jgi:type IV secretory pathway VirB4 component
MSTTFRKHWAGLTVVTQDIDDVLGSELGRAIVANAATTVLLRQSPQAIDGIAATFTLSEGQRQFLLAADPELLATLQDAESNPAWVEL